jgi:pimeloyl-ACP methyl ester carboxylesterase
VVVDLPHAHLLSREHVTATKGVMMHTCQIRAGLSALILLFACASSHAQPATREPQMVNVGGRMMRALLAGTEGRKPGQPALILEAGAAAGLDEWSSIFPELARLAPVVAYDRRGLGRSETDTQPQNYRRVAQSLHDLLTAVQVPPPYILVGHSFGGMYIRGFSDMFAQEVIGYVYVEAFDFDGTPEEKAAAFPEAERAQALAPPVLPPIPPDTPPGLLAEMEFLKGEMLSGGVEGRKLQQKPGVPVAVIIAAPPGRLKHPGEIMMRLQIKHQSEWALQSSKALLIVSGDSGHNVQKDAPELVLLAVRHVLRNAPAWTK